LLLGGGLIGSAIWGASVTFEPKNVALHKPVSTSSVHPRSISPSSGLTDGVKTGAYGAHTDREEASWVQVDLTDVYRIDSVKIYNRGDGWFDDCLPLTLLFSENGTDFVEAETRTASFSQVLPWTFEPKRTRARYVRVGAARGGFVALAEVEVFGKK
jgi:hypothetical protein